MIDRNLFIGLQCAHESRTHFRAISQLNLDETQGQKYMTPCEDRKHYPVVIVLARQAW